MPTKRPPRQPVGRFQVGTKHLDTYILTENKGVFLADIHLPIFLCHQPLS